MPDRPPSRWVACDACEKWRLVPWHADFDDAGDEPFFCKDQVRWGAPAAEACCDFPEPTWGEDDMVFECSTLDVDALVNAAGVGAMASFLDVETDAFDQCVAVNCRAPLVLSQCVARNMIARGVPGAVVRGANQPSERL